jgi:hypothetical protein
MGADIESPHPDGCVAAAQPSWNSLRTFKERLVASFCRNSAGDGNGDDKTAKPPNGHRVDDDTISIGKNPTGVAGSDTIADVAAAKPVKRGWRSYVLFVIGAIFLLVCIASVYPMTQAKDRLHMVLWGIGVFGGFFVAKLCMEIAVLI